MLPSKEQACEENAVRIDEPNTTVAKAGDLNTEKNSASKDTVVKKKGSIYKGRASLTRFFSRTSKPQVSEPSRKRNSVFVTKIQTSRDKTLCKSFLLFHYQMAFGLAAAIASFSAGVEMHAINNVAVRLQTWYTQLMVLYTIFCIVLSGLLWTHNIVYNHVLHALTRSHIALQLFLGVSANIQMEMQYGEGITTVNQVLRNFLLSLALVKMVMNRRVNPLARYGIFICLSTLHVLFNDKWTVPFEFSVASMFMVSYTSGITWRFRSGSKAPATSYAALSCFAYTFLGRSEEEYLGSISSSSNHKVFGMMFGYEKIHVKMTDIGVVPVSNLGNLPLFGFALIGKRIVRTQI